MFHKIQPEQIQLPTFSSPSGSINFEVGSNFVYANLSNALTGNFFITGQLFINNQKVQFSDPSNTVASGTSNFILGGKFNNIQGTGNVVLNGIYNTLNGNSNSVVNGEFCDFSVNSIKNTVLAGAYCSFQSGVTGSAILGDTRSYSKPSYGSNTLSIYYESGAYFNNTPVILDNSDIYLTSSASGVFSGDCSFFGNLKKGGLTVATTGDIFSANTGIKNDLVNTGIYAVSVKTDLINTGVYAVSVKNSLDILSGNSLLKTGSQVASGQKTFAQDTVFSESILIKGNSGILSGVNGSTTQIPIDSGDSVGQRGLISYSGEYLFLKISDNPNQWIRFSGQSFW
jgi:hypothetical protein